MAPFGHTDGDAGRERDVVGNLEQATKLVLNAEVPHGEGSAVPESTCCEEQVLARGIDRRSLHGIRFPISIKAHEHDNRDPFEVVDVVLHRIREPARAVTIGVTFGVPSRAERVSQQRLGSDGIGPIVQNKESKGLTIRSGWSPSGMPKNCSQIVFEDRICGVSTDRTSRREAFEQAHRRVSVHTKAT
jgi:hypothetical protein